MGDRFTDDITYAVKDKDGFYFAGLNQWDKQIRKAYLYRSYKYAKAIRDDERWADRDRFIVKVRTVELGECNCDE